MAPEASYTPKPSPCVASPYLPFKLAFEHPRPSPSSAETGVAATNANNVAAAIGNIGFMWTGPFRCSPGPNAVLATPGRPQMGCAGAVTAQRIGGKIFGNRLKSSENQT